MKVFSLMVISLADPLLYFKNSKGKQISVVIVVDLSPGAPAETQVLVPRVMKSTREIKLEVEMEIIY